MDRSMASADAAPFYESPFTPADTESALFLGNSIQDNVATAFIALAGEVWVTRRKLLVVQELLSEGLVVTAQAIETYAPSSAVQERWDKERDEFVRRVFSAMTGYRDRHIHVGSDWTT
jgi:hypothetical protein